MEGNNQAPLDGDLQGRMEDLAKWSTDYAQKSGFRINPNEKIVFGIMRGLLENEKKHGKKICPCRRFTGNEETDAKNVCPCFYHKDEIEADGHCLCNLFVKK